MGLSHVNITNSFILSMKPLNNWFADCKATIVLASFVAFVCLIVFYLALTFTKEYLFGLQIPGPFPYPILGNILQIGTHPHLTLHKMADKYGDVMKIKVGRKTVVVINNFKAVKEGLSVKDVQFAGRPSTYLGSLVSKGGHDIVFADYGEVWKYHRWVGSTGIRRMMGPGMENLQEITNRETSRLIEIFKSYIGKDFDPYNDISLAVTNIICSLVFGENSDPENANFQQELKYIATIAESFGNPVSYLVEAFPFLHVLPFQSMKRLQEALSTRDKTLSRQFQNHKTKFKSDTLKDFMDFLLNLMWDTHSGCYDASKENDFKMLAFDLLGAGLDTTIIAIRWALVYLVLWPDTQARAHREMDQHLPKAKILQIENKSKLPYLECIVLETLRMCSLFPIVPRKTTRPTSIRGYNIPQGTDIIFNLWSANHDSSFWEEPQKFMPDRFLDDNMKIIPLAKLSFFPFSSGCRNCPGETLAKNELFLIIGRLLQTFCFEAAETKPTLESVPAVAFRPKKYRIRVKLRRRLELN